MSEAQVGAGTLAVSDPTCYLLDSSTTIDCRAASNYAAGIGNQVEVTATQPFTFLTPIIGDLFFGGAVTLSASSRAPVMNPYFATIHAGPSYSPDPTPSPSPSPSPSPDPDSAPGRDALAVTIAHPEPDADPDVHDADVHQDSSSTISWSSMAVAGYHRQTGGPDPGRRDDWSAPGPVGVPCDSEGWVKDK